MFIGACLDLGVDPLVLLSALQTLDLKGWSCSPCKVERGGISATLANIEVDSSARMTIVEMMELVGNSPFSALVRGRCETALSLLADAEKGVHGGDGALHELGSIDTVLDLVGSFLALELLGVESVYFSPLAVGRGLIPMAHGLFPNPAPAVARLLMGLELSFRKESFEFTTPTGAAIVSALGAGFEPTPMKFRLNRVGYGAGSADTEFGANTLQAFLGEDERPIARQLGEVGVISVHLDDMSGELLSGIVDEALVMGAIDGWLTPTLGKKGRPSYEVTVISPANFVGELVSWLQGRTHSLGARIRMELRSVVGREMVTVEVQGHEISIKVTPLGAKVEFDDAKAVSEALGISIAQVNLMALAKAAESGILGDPVF